MEKYISIVKSLIKRKNEEESFDFGRDAAGGLRGDC